MKRIQSNMSKDFDLKSALRKRGYVTGEDGIDQIPAKLTKGEAVLPRETVDAIGGPEGVDNLILRTAGHRAMPTMKNGEIHAALGMSDVTDALGNAKDWIVDKAGNVMRKGARAAGAATSPQAAEAVGRAAGEAVNTLRTGWRQAQGAFSEGAANGPQAAPPQGPPAPPTYDPKADKSFQSARQSTAELVKKAGGVVNNTGETLGAAPKANPGLRTRAGGMAVATALEAPKLYEDMTTPGVTTADNVARGAESVGRLSSAWLGAKAGGTLGALTGPFAPVATPLGVLAGGAAGYYAPDLVASGMRYFGGSDEPILPSERAADLRQKAAAPKKPTYDFNSLPQGDPSYDRKEKAATTGVLAARENMNAKQPGGSSGDELQAARDMVARRNHEDRMNAYARESALRKQMAEDNVAREYNPGTGLAEVMPETDMFGQTAAQRDAGMHRFNASVALSRVAQGGKRSSNQALIAQAEGLNKLADDTLKAENDKIAVKKGMVGTALMREAGLRGKGMDVAAERQKSLDAREAARYRDDQGLAGDKYKADAAVEAARLGLKGEEARAYAAAYAANLKARGDRETAGTKALDDRLATAIGDPNKDPNVREEYNDVRKLLTGTMAKHGYPAEMLNDPRILEKLVVATQRARGTRDSEKNLLSVLKGLWNPNRVALRDSDIGSDYDLRALGPQGIISRDARTNAGDVSSKVFEWDNPNSTLWGRLTGSNLRRKEYTDQVDSLPKYER